jgi:uncharacterized RDD family membrane protein YckC
MPAVGDDLTRYDCGDWRPDQRRALERLLDGAAVPYAWDGGLLEVPGDRRRLVDDMVDLVDDEDDGRPLFDDEPAPGAPVGPVGPDERWPVIAARSRRVVGYVVDVIVVDVGVLAFFAAVRVWSDGDGRIVRWAWLAAVLAAAYEIVPVAVAGRTLGKLVAGTRVVVDGEGRVPGWGRAIARWAVPALPVLLMPYALGGAPRFFAFTVWPIVVYGPVLFDPMRRGLHDRAAGTVVVLVPAVTPRPRRDASGVAGRDGVAG